VQGETPGLSHRSLNESREAYLPGFERIQRFRLWPLFLFVTPTDFGPGSRFCLCGFCRGAIHRFRHLANEPGFRGEHLRYCPGQGKAPMARHFLFAPCRRQAGPGGSLSRDRRPRCSRIAVEHHFTVHHAFPTKVRTTCDHAPPGRRSGTQFPTLESTASSLPPSHTDIHSAFEREIECRMPRPGQVLFCSTFLDQQKSGTWFYRSAYGSTMPIRIIIHEGLDFLQQRSQRGNFNGLSASPLFPFPFSILPETLVHYEPHNGSNRPRPRSTVC
jgi:hypothetical protein